MRHGLRELRRHQGRRRDRGLRDGRDRPQAGGRSRLMTQRRPPSHGKPPGQRQLRVGEQVRHALTRILREGKFRDPDLSAPEMVTVTAVELGPDLKHAHVYVMPLGGKDIDKTVAALNRAAAYMRGELGKALDLRNTP